MDTTAHPPLVPDRAAGQQLLSLPPCAAAPQPVQSLHGRTGQTLLLQVLQGRVWLTREGELQDVFLAAGQCWRGHGAVRLHLSAEGAAGARLLVQRLQERGQSG